MLSAFLEFDTGADIRDLSSLDFYDDEAFAGEDVIVTNGFDKVANSLATGIDVRLNTIVKAVHSLNDAVRIKTDKGDVVADAVLVTVPLGVLKRGVISFKPDLPRETRNAIDRIGMGVVNKFLCVWRESFWDERLQYLGLTPETKGKFNYFLNAKRFIQSNALMTFAFGDYALETESMTDTEVTDEIVKHLRIIYGAGVPQPMHLLRTKWGQDEFTFGSYSFVSNRSRSSEFDRFKGPINGRMFFAGEHTSRDYRATVHGAYLSGQRAAAEIMDEIA